jgi:hypothetical protein
MRAPRESLLFLFLMTAVCLAAGVVFGIGTGQFVQPPKASATPGQLMATGTAAPAVSVSVTPGLQKSLLLIGVTDANAASTSLEVCWIITFRPGLPEYYVLAFPPSARFELASLHGQRTLSEIHAEDLRLQLDHNFVRDAVQSRFPAFTIQADVTLDRSDLSALIGQLGGLPMHNQVLTGPSVLQTYDNWPAASDLDRLRLQGDILHQLFALLGQRQWSVGDLVTFVTQIPRVSADPETVSSLENFARGAPPVAGASLVWREFGPEMEAVNASSGSPP